MQGDVFPSVGHLDSAAVPSMKPAYPHVLTINGGSSSIKFALFEVGDSLRRILEGGIERIGQPTATLRLNDLHETNHLSRVVKAPNHTAAAVHLRKWTGSAGNPELEMECASPAAIRKPS